MITDIVIGMDAAEWISRRENFIDMIFRNIKKFIGTVALYFAPLDNDADSLKAYTEMRLR